MQQNQTFFSDNKSKESLQEDLLSVFAFSLPAPCFSYHLGDMLILS